MQRVFQPMFQPLLQPMFGWLLQAIVMALLASAATLASAQALDPNSIVNAGAQVTKLIDDGRYAEVWEGASPVAKKAIPKAQFIETVAKLRQTLGAAATSRIWMNVSRRDAAGAPDLPAGIYMNVEYRSSFANGKTAREMVSFRFDDDKVWRFTGYVVN